MKIHFTLALLLSSFIGFGQKCKYDVEKKDPFTKQIVKSISARLNYLGTVELTFREEEKKYLIGIHIVIFGKKENYIEPGDSLFLALDNGGPVSLISTEKYLPTYYSGNGAINTVYNPLYTVREEELRKLSGSDISAIKLPLGNEPFIYEVQPKYGEKAKKAAGCILQ